MPAARLALVRKPHLAPPHPSHSIHSTDSGSLLDVLPDDALDLILAALNVQSLCRARCLNQRTRRLAREIALWRALLCRTIATIGWHTRAEQLELLPMCDILTLLQAHPKQHQAADADVAAPLRRLDHFSVSSKLRFTSDNLGVAYGGTSLGGNRAVRATAHLPMAVHDELRPLRTNEPSGLLLRALAAAARGARSESRSPSRRAASDASWSPSTSASSAPSSPATLATALRSRCDGFSLDDVAGSSASSSAAGSPLTSPLDSFSAGSRASMSSMGGGLVDNGDGSPVRGSFRNGSRGSGIGGESLYYVLDRGCQVGYFEVEILPVPSDGRASAAAEGGAGPDCVAVGLCTAKFALVGKQPGWDPESFGYHGDDGRIFHGSGVRSTAYGPRFGAGDVIGCGISLTTRRIFYTLNGTYLGAAFVAKPPQLPLYPVAGLDTFSPIVFNLGATPFRFDLASLPSSLHAQPPRKLRVPRCLAGFGGALSAATAGGAFPAGV